jgi:hypothetical protein
VSVTGWQLLTKPMTASRTDLRIIAGTSFIIKL